MKVLAIICCEIVLVHTLGCARDSTFMPVNGAPISSQIPTSVQVVIPTLQFECQALITGANIQAIGDLNFDLQIWRPQGTVGTLYNLVWRRPFRIRALGRDSPVNTSFVSSPGVPVRPGDVIGFHSFVSPRFLFDVSQQHEVYYVEARQGPLCNFSLEGPGVKHRTFPLPFISLTYVNATNREVRLAEQRLPSIDKTCTPVSFTIDRTMTSTTTTHTTLTVSSSVSSSSQEQVTTASSRSSSDSEPVNGPGSSVTEGGSDDDFFLALSFTEFILVVVVLVVVLVSICVVVTIALCCCMYVQRMTQCKGKAEPPISMNANPVYDTIAGQRRPCPGSQLQPPCAGQQPTLVALVPPCNQALLQASTYGGSQKTLSDRGTPSTESYSSNSPCQQQIQLTRPSSTEDYSYPRLRMQLQEQDNQHTSDGYIIVQPDHFIQDRNDTEENACAADKESNGPRGAMDDTL